MLKRAARLATTKSGVALGKRLSSLGLLIALFIASVGAIYAASRPEIAGWTALALFLAATSVGVILAQLFYDLEGWFEQRGRDIDAAHLWDNLAADQPAGDFILYLRPFISTNQIAETTHQVIPIRATPTAGAPMFLAPAADRVEFEEEIEKALRRIGPLVALGQPMEHMGAGRIRVSDEVWQDAIGRLIDRAALIILLPSPRPGTSWEVERVISSGALKRAILVDPPNERGSEDGDYDPAAEWVGVRESFEQHGYQLPEDDPEGLLIHFGDSLAPERAERISLADSEGHIRAFARKILKSQRAQSEAPEPRTSHA